MHEAFHQSVDLREGEWKAELPHSFFELTLRDKPRTAAIEHLETMPIVDACFVGEGQRKNEDGETISERKRGWGVGWGCGEGDSGGGGTSVR